MAVFGVKVVVSICVLMYASTCNARPGPGEPGLNDWCFMRSDCNQDNPNSAWNKGLCKTGKTQSPIDITANYDSIPGDTVVDFSDGLENYVFNHFKLSNDGKHIELVDFKNAKGHTPSFKWAAKADSVYTLVQAHLHWGPTDEEGSEHTIGGKQHSMELHMVHYRSAGGPDGGYKDFASAKKSGVADALSVVAVFVQAGNKESTASLSPVISSLGKVMYRGDKYSVDATELRLGDLIQIQPKFITYSGSLTTPTCDEVVAWLIGTEHVEINKDDISAFRKLIHGVDERPLTTNRRRTQEANDRLVGIVTVKH